MVRILFVVNDEPHEAFAISAARETMNAFQAQGFSIYRIGKDEIPQKPEGNEIIWGKINPKETFLGGILKTDKVNLSVEELQNLAMMPFLRRKKWAMQYSPLVTYTFHCSPHDKDYWEVMGKVDYTIEAAEGPNDRVVEVKAVYKKMPQRILEKYKEKTGAYPEKESRTTSTIDTKKAGLHPEEFGKAIAKAIKKEIGRVKTILDKGRLERRLIKFQRRRIKRVWDSAPRISHKVPKVK
jgi:hypothetical protein